MSRLPLICQFKSTSRRYPAKETHIRPHPFAFFLGPCYPPHQSFRAKNGALHRKKGTKYIRVCGKRPSFIRSRQVRAQWPRQIFLMCPQFDVESTFPSREFPKNFNDKKNGKRVHSSSITWTCDLKDLFNRHHICLTSKNVYKLI